MSTPRVPSINEQFYIHPDEIGSEYGAPIEIVPHVSDRLIQAVGNIGIDPDSVVFTGFNGDPKTLDERKLTSTAVNRAVFDVEEVGRQIAALQDHFEDGTADIHLDALFGDGAEGEVDLDEILRNTRGESQRKPQYYFANKGELNSDLADNNNPIHFAGTVPTATIDVYDSKQLERLGLPIIGGEESLSVRGLKDELKPAHVLRFKPKYRPLKSEPRAQNIEWRPGPRRPEQ